MRFIFNLQRRKICSFNTVVYNIQIKWVSPQLQQTLTWVVALDVWIRISFHSSPMLQINCLSSVMLAPPSPCYSWTHPLDHTPLIPHTYAYDFRQQRDDIGTSELCLIRLTPLLMLFLALDKSTLALEDAFSLHHLGLACPLSVPWVSAMGTSLWVHQ